MPRDEIRWEGDCFRQRPKYTFGQKFFDILIFVMIFLMTGVFLIAAVDMLLYSKLLL